MQVGGFGLGGEKLGPFAVAYAEELGGVYESLLALTPQISADGARFTFAEFAGNERKTSGSYYTPDSLVQGLLDSALDPVVEEAINRLLPTMPRRATIERSLADRGVLALVRDLEEACAIANQIAAEHLELVVADPWHWAERIRHAGALFLGPWSSESLGDYCAGPNHVLPTMRTARFSSPLGVYDFQKRTSLIAISAAGAQQLGPIAATLADGEGLGAHARSARMRLTVAEGDA